MAKNACAFIAESRKTLNFAPAVKAFLWGMGLLPVPAILQIATLAVQYILWTRKKTSRIKTNRRRS